MIRFGSIVFFGLILNQSQAQVPDTARVQEIDSVSVSAFHTIVRVVPSHRSYLSAEVLRAINASDVGDLMRYVPGVNLKSYGGLGGMKTISSRGLSSQDNAIVVDGFLLAIMVSGIS